MSTEQIVTGDWTVSCPNPQLSPLFSFENGEVKIRSNEGRYVFGYCEKQVDAKPGSFYRLEIKFRVDGVNDIMRSVMCMAEWEQGRPEGERMSQDIAGNFSSNYSSDGDTITGRLDCRAPANTSYAKIQLGLRYAPGGSVTIFDVLWSEIPAPVHRKAKAGVCNWNPALADNENAYLKNLGEILDSAGEHSCDIMLLPEFCDTYQWEKDFLNAVPLTGNLTISTAKLYAKKYKMYIAAPVVERDGDSIYNCTAIIGRDGNIVGKYRKTHLYWPEAFLWGLTPGDEFPVFELDFGNVAVQTCYDNWNADVCKLYALKGAELILMPNEGYDPLIMPARAVDNRIFLAISSLAFEGLIYSPLGERISSGKGLIQMAEIDMDDRIPPYPVAGGSCNYAMGARRIVHNSVSDKVYREIIEQINKNKDVDENFIDYRCDISGELNR